MPPYNQYEPIPSNADADVPSPYTDTESDVEEVDSNHAVSVAAHHSYVANAQRLLDRDPRFNRPKPSALKRIGLIVFIIFMFWLALSMRKMRKVEPTVIHANRYSKEFKFRPAASPIVTETLVDGRVKLRGALPSPSTIPIPQAEKNTEKRTKSAKAHLSSAKKKKKRYNSAARKSARL